MTKGTHHILQGSQLGLQLDRRHPRGGPHPFFKGNQHALVIHSRSDIDRENKMTQFTNLFYFLLTDIQGLHLRAYRSKYWRIKSYGYRQVDPDKSPIGDARSWSHNWLFWSAWWTSSIIRPDKIWQTRRRVAGSLLLAGFGRSWLVTVVNISTSCRIGIGSRNCPLPLLMTCPFLLTVENTLP